MKKIIKLISNNKIIIFPTDTIYGFSCNKQNNNIIYKILFIKKRSYNLHLSIITYSINKLFLWIKNIPINIKKIIKKNYPGKLTIIFKKNYTQKNTKTVAIRIPKIKIIKNILRPFSGIISTSVNESNILQMINHKIIKKYLNTKIDFLLKKNIYIQGIESKIISNKKTIRKHKIKNLSFKNIKSKIIKKKNLFEIYNIIFYEKIINNSINILYFKKIYLNINFAKKNKKNLKKNLKYKNIIKNINIITKNYGNIILILKKN